jgi:hypothetical protein
MRNIVEKLGASDRTHAVTIALTRGILRLGDRSDRARMSGGFAECLATA